MSKESINLDAPIVVTVHPYIRITGIFLGIISIFLGTLILIASNTVTPIIIGILFYVIGIYLISMVLFNRIGFDGDQLIKRGILQKQVISLTEIQSIERMKIFGTVGNVPVSFALIEFLTLDNRTKKFRLRLFSYEEMLPIIQTIKMHLE